MKLSTSSINLTLIFFFSFLFSILVKSNFYGYGIDYYAIYRYQNILSGGWENYLGWKIATLAILEIPLGLNIVSFFLSFSVGILFKEYFSLKKINNNLLLIFLFIITIHTWPIIMSSVNAMRQGVCMSFIYLSFYFLLRNYNKTSLLMIFLSIFSHTSGLIFFCIYTMTLVFRYLLNQKINSKIFLVLLILLVLNFSYYFTLKYIGEANETSRIIAGDYRLPFFIINIFYFIYCTINLSFLKKSFINVYLYTFSSIAITTLALGLNWEYERLNMMMLMPLIFSSGDLFNKRSTIIFWFTTINLLFLLTLFSEVYESLK